MSTTVGAAKPVLALKSTLFERAGVPGFPHDLKASKYFAEQRANSRYDTGKLTPCMNIFT